MTVVPFTAPASKTDEPATVRLGAQHLRLLAGALGFDAFATPAARRNYITCVPGSRDFRLISELARDGLMTLAAGPLWRGQYVYVVTQRGREALDCFSGALNGEDPDVL